jgi:serine/threonine protein kinase
LSPTAGYVFAHYRVAAAIGAGGMGEVYRATDTRLGRDVAVKVLTAELARDPERLARFAREAHLLASLNHPNTLPNYDVTREGRFLMLRRGTQGGTLKVVLNWTEELKRALAKGGTP